MQQTTSGAAKCYKQASAYPNVYVAVSIRYFSVKYSFVLRHSSVTREIAEKMRSNSF